MCLGMMVRILVGPLPLFGAVTFHYETRINLVSLLTLLTLKIVVKTLFILDFDRMAMIAETKMMMWICGSTTIFTLTHLALEAFLRNHRGLGHYPRWCLSVYISKVFINI